MNAPPPIRSVLADLAPDFVLTPEVEGRVREALRAAGGTPWYLRALMGFGAWVGTWFLLSFVLLFLAIPFRDHVEGAAVVIGFALTAGAVALRRAATHEFVRLTALVVSLTGQGLFVGGLGGSGDSVEAAAVAGFVVSVAAILVFPDRVHRFLSTCAAVTALTTLVYAWRIPHGAEGVALLLMATTLWLWRAAPLPVRLRQAELTGPVVSGAIVSLFGLLLLASILNFAELRAPVWLAQSGPVTAGAVLGLLWLIHEVMDEHQPGRFGVEALIASAAVVLLAAITWRTPAITTTLFAVALGFDRRRPGIVALAVAFFLGFGALYYYNLELTLLQKSAVLAGSGVLCLAAWGAVRWMASSGAEETAA